MSNTLSSVAAWRRMLLIAITALTALLAVSFTAPQEAHAFRDPTVVLSGHTGWVYTRSLPQCLAPTCTTPNHAAWRWSGTAWQRASIPAGTQVYAYPYAAPWHWIWTQRTGWLAIETSKLETGYRCTGYACPMF